MHALSCSTVSLAWQASGKEIAGNVSSIASVTNINDIVHSSGYCLSQVHHSITSESHDVRSGALLRLPDYG